MDSSSLKCLERGKLVLNSGLLHKSWSRISELYESTTYQNQDLKVQIYQEAKYTIVVFAAPLIHTDYTFTHLSGTQDENPFHFLYLEKISSFSLHTPAFQLFDCARKDLLHLKSELLELLKFKEHVIITGAALGGSVASLFTLWLLETVEPKLKRPLCITFGSPLIGDVNLQQILENSLRNSCFLHVADAAQTPIKAGFKPFGTFLICIGSQCICIDDPESVTELLGGAETDVLGLRDYGEVLGRLAQPLLVEDSRVLIDEGVINRMEERAANEKPRCDPLTKLNHMKISMAKLEWYKKKSEELKMSFYDWYKTPSPVKMDAEMRKRELNDYWTSLVEEVEKIPQSEKSLLKTRSLFSANNYRRMVEPLDIAEYYRDGGKEYRNSRTSGRFRHYVMLEKLFKAEGIKPPRSPGSDLTHLLTFDSCFWSEVEEAVLVTNELNKQVVGREVLLEKLMRFEDYVWESIKKREVSPEIFLDGSSFMKWWREYKEIRGLHSPPSDFTRFMNNRMYESYGQPC